MKYLVVDISNHSNTLSQHHAGTTFICVKKLPLSIFPLPDTPLRRTAKSSIKVIIYQEQETLPQARIVSVELET